MLPNDMSLLVNWDQETMHVMHLTKDVPRTFLNNVNESFTIAHEIGILWHLNCLAEKSSQKVGLFSDGRTKLI